MLGIVVDVLRSLMQHIFIAVVRGDRVPAPDCKRTVVVVYKPRNGIIDPFLPKSGNELLPRQTTFPTKSNLIGDDPSYN